MSKQHVINFTLNELKKLIDDKSSCVILNKCIYNLQLYPYHLYDISASIKEILNAKVAKYDKKLDGILLGFKNLKLLTPQGSIICDSCFIHVDVEGDFYIFKPKIDSLLTGVVSKKSDNHIGCLVHRLFNVSVPNTDEENWIGHDVNIGDEVSLRVMFIDLEARLPYIRTQFVNHLTKTEDNLIDFETKNVSLSKIKKKVKSQSTNNESEININIDKELENIKTKLQSLLKKKKLLKSTENFVPEVNKKPEELIEKEIPIKMKKKKEKGQRTNNCESEINSNNKDLEDIKIKRKSLSKKKNSEPGNNKLKELIKNEIPIKKKKEKGQHIKNCEPKINSSNEDLEDIKIKRKSLSKKKNSEPEVNNKLEELIKNKIPIKKMKEKGQLIKNCEPEINSNKDFKNIIKRKSPSKKKNSVPEVNNKLEELMKNKIPIKKKKEKGQHIKNCKTDINSNNEDLENIIKRKSLSKKKNSKPEGTSKLEEFIENEISAKKKQKVKSQPMEEIEIDASKKKKNSKINHKIEEKLTNNNTSQVDLGGSQIKKIKKSKKSVDNELSIVNTNSFEKYNNIEECLINNEINEEDLNLSESQTKKKKISKKSFESELRNISNNSLGEKKKRRHSESNNELNDSKYEKQLEEDSTNNNAYQNNLPNKKKKKLNNSIDIADISFKKKKRSKSSDINIEKEEIRLSGSDVINNNEDFTLLTDTQIIEQIRNFEKSSKVKKKRKSAEHKHETDSSEINFYASPIIMADAEDRNTKKRKLSFNQNVIWNNKELDLHDSDLEKTLKEFSEPIDESFHLAKICALNESNKVKRNDEVENLEKKVKKRKRNSSETKDVQKKKKLSKKELETNAANSKPIIQKKIKTKNIKP